MDDVSAAGPSSPPQEANDRVYAFGDFRLAPGARLLSRNGAAVRLGARAFDILIALVERAGELVGKAELFERVWPGVFVDESSLRVQIAALRRALGDAAAGGRFIASVPGRGYSFVAEVKDQDALAHPADQDHAARLEPIFGRDDVIQTVVWRLPLKRFVTITGPGGIGKTSVAVTAAAWIAGNYRDGVRVIDLSPLTSSRQVAAHIASLLRISAPSADPLQTLVAYLSGRNLLLVLDNCEHVVTAATEIAEQIRAAAPDVHLLTTSREPLRARGEWVQRLEPLSFPPADARLSIEDLRAFPSCQLFLERWAACDSAIDPKDEDAPVVAEICRKLDGLPLAIELAAARAPLFGLRRLRDRLDDRFAILTKGRRSAAPRHRTLMATIDWSFETLSDAEKTLWRRLGVVRDAFTLEAAKTLGLNGAEPLCIVDALDSLVEKSLVTIDARGDERRYRLPESLRLYALDKLIESGELECAQRRHAEYWLARSVQAGDAWIELPTRDWLLANGGNIADVRAALDWALGPTGDALLAIELTAASAPIWFKMLMIPELRGYLERALELAAQNDAVDPRLVLRMRIALAHAIYHMLGPVAAVREVLETAVAIAERLDDAGALTHIFWALSGCASVVGDYDAMTRDVARLDALRQRRNGEAIQATYDRMAALGAHLTGSNEKALVHVKAALTHAAVKIGDGGLIYDHTLATKAHYSRILWALGRPATALEVIDDAIAYALRLNQPFAFGYFLVLGACPVALWSGRLDLFGQYVASLLDESIGIPLTIWRKSGEIYRQTQRFLTQGEKADEARRILGEMSVTPSQAERLSTFDWRLLRPECLADAAAGRINWSTPEVLRAQGETLLAGGSETARAEAEPLFRRAIEISRNQQCLAWELRATVSLARLRRAERYPADLLGPVIDRFEPGADIEDLRIAKELLDRRP